MDLYVAYYSRLLQYATTFVKNRDDAEDIVQDAFTNLLEHPGNIDEVRDIDAYMFTLIKNRCRDYMRHFSWQQRRLELIRAYFEMDLDQTSQLLSRWTTFGKLDDEVIHKMFLRAVNDLPKRCRLIFVMSRINNLKYQEIANKLGISTSTVENQIGIALRKLRVALAECFAA